MSENSSVELEAAAFRDVAGLESGPPELNS